MGIREEITLADIEKVQNNLKTLEKDCERKKGRLDQAYGDLLKFSCKSVDEANEALKQLGKQAEKSKQALEELVDELRRSYPQLFEGN